MTKKKAKPPIDTDLWHAAADIWASCRGMEWTLDSERAIKLIYNHLANIRKGEEDKTKGLRRELHNAECKVMELKKYIVEARRSKTWR